MNKTIIMSIALALLGLNCESQQNAMKTEVNSDVVNVPKTKIATENNSNLINLEIGKSHFVKEAQTNITYLSKVVDSRCPPNTNCIQAGNTIIEVELMSTTSRPVKIKLAMQDEVKLGLTKTYNFQGFSYELMAVNTKNFPSKKFDFNTIDVKVVRNTEKTSSGIRK